MIIQDLAPDDVGSYQVLVSDENGSLASDTASVSTLFPPANRLINVDVNSGSSATYHGDGILVGNSGFDVWNGINGQSGFTNVVLVDETRRSMT
jgi:hypothetical protein